MVVRKVGGRWSMVALSMLLLLDGSPDCVEAQSLFSGGGRPFVVGFTPVIGRNGGVGGVDVDARGVLQKAVRSVNTNLDVKRASAKNTGPGELRRHSPMRKVSLRRMEAEIEKYAATGKPLPSELLLMAGLQRIEWVFAYPKLQDIVIAGPAEGWAIQDHGIVGRTSGDAVLRLDDLLDALHAVSTDEDGSGITCSIDPTEQGMRRVQKLFQRRAFVASHDGLKQLEREAGDQNVTVTGVRPSSHFARVMVSADYQMKRIAMGLDQSPVADLPSYMDLAQRKRGSAGLLAPRWWLAPAYQTVEHSKDRLAWRFQGSGIQALSEHGYLNSRGELVNAGRPSPLGKLWAEKLNAAYDQLGKKATLFSQLRGCVDLAVAATILTHEGLFDRVNCPLPLMMNPSRIQGENFPVPTTVPAQANLVRGRQGTVVSVSGGVDLSSLRVLERSVATPELSPIREKAKSEDSQRWWWD